MDFLGRGDDDEDLHFARGSSLSEQFVQRYKPRMMAQEAALKEVARRKSRCLLRYDESFNCKDARVGDSVVSYKASNSKGSPRRRGPAKILDVDDAGVTVKFQSQTFKVARHCVRGRLDAQDAGGRIPATTYLRRNWEASKRWSVGFVEGRRFLDVESGLSSGEVGCA